MRASPVQWAGPKRFHQPPISIADLPPIKAIILSHNHYDHLDYAAVLQLAAKTEHFVAPLGVGDTLVEWGVPKEKVQQFDWWQGTTIAGVKLVATPSQHFSGRGLFDGNQTLWASWVIDAPDVRVFFSGDSGYFDGFKSSPRPRSISRGAACSMAIKPCGRRGLSTHRTCACFSAATPAISTASSRSATNSAPST